MDVIGHNSIYYMTCHVGISLEASCDDHIRSKVGVFFGSDIRAIQSTCLWRFLSRVLILCHCDIRGTHKIAFIDVVI